ncbi:hypothetical protein OGAPHI_002349 [Ogataea philodendri]|uniref:non-specific serine/threonine protein kinase n=1 Tax=Ogataea philodendri TaxID=1378263 RepID=A0A9P8PBB0_9ASCO|nr:uncharacterized protein OGAPHI_002349 [Ogataea philodendri]KAH3668595.1 hypothetical protein OGAPHI_002349 [Ogataea philodendri]
MPHSRQESYASSFVSSSALGLGISNPSSKSTPTKNPVKIGPWKLGKTLGKGATGRVLLASNTHTGQKAAVKVVSKSLLGAEGQDASSAGLSYGIEREIIIMKLLNHKNVLRLYDVWETDNALYLVLEYVEGGELFDLLVESGPLPENTAVEFFRQIILGASYCHSLGICHRDLKPENLLLDKQYNVKIADFGMAALESTDRLLETSCGSPHYAAPEIVSGLQYHGAESDVWSCGVILFALLTGRLPFDDENIRELLLKVQRGSYEIHEDLSPEARDLISQMLTVDPEERIKTRDVLKHPLITKYPFNKQDHEDYLNLPSPNSATQPVKSREEIDRQILENLVILWHGKDPEAIVESLLSTRATPEKTFYSLLMRYRHDHSDQTQTLVRSSSVISKVTPVTPASSGTSSPQKKRSSMRNFSAGTASNRPVSFQRSKAEKPIEKSPIRKRISVGSRRNSMLFMNESKRNSLNFADNGVSKRLSNTRLKRNSVTSKLLSTYAKLAAIDENKTNNVQEYGKRASADFAALCDMLFDGKSNRMSNASSLAAAGALLADDDKSSKSSRKTVRHSLITAKKRQSTFASLFDAAASVKGSSSGESSKSIRSISSKRLSSNPMERISRILNASDLENINRRSISHGVTPSVNPPPKPVTQLDPRAKAYEKYQKRLSQTLEKMMKQKEEDEKKQKEKEEKEKEEQEKQEKLDAETKKEAPKQPRKINRNPEKLSDVTIPQVTRKSRHLSDGKRYSVLSIYSASQAKDAETKANDRNSKATRLSMVFQEDSENEADDTVDMNLQLDKKDEGLYFVDTKRKSNVKSMLMSSEDIPHLKYRESRDTMISSNSADKSLYKSLRLPEIPGSPIKDDKVDVYEEPQSRSKHPKTPKESKEPQEAEGKQSVSPVVASKKNDGTLQFSKQRKPLGEIDQHRKDNETNKQVPSGGSFFRKLSFGSRKVSEPKDTKRKVSITQAFLALFTGEISDEQETKELRTVLNEDDLFEAVKSLLVSWKQHGIDDLQVKKSTRRIVASVAKRNSFGLKACKFECQAYPSENGSLLVFTNLRGPSRSFSKLTRETERILEKESILA